VSGVSLPSPPWQKVVVALLGTFVALLCLECGLRLCGIEFRRHLTVHNLHRLDSNPDQVVLCLGESTTAMGGETSYPRQLDTLLNERGDGRTFGVANGGIGGANSTVILTHLDTLMKLYQPDVVVAMMGINDSLDPDIAREGFGEVRGLDHLRIYRLVKLLTGPMRYRSQMRLYPPVPADEDGSVIPHEAAFRDLSGKLDEGGWLCHQARLHHQLGRTERATALLTEALEIDPTNPELYVELGRYQHARGLDEEARSLLSEAVRVAPQSAVGPMALGWYWEQKGRWVEAEDAYRLASKRAPSWVEVHRRLAHVAEQMGDIERAERLLLRTFEFDGTCVTFRRLVELYVRLGRRDAVDALAWRVTPESLGDGELMDASCWRDAYGSALRQLGDEEAAETYLAPRWYYGPRLDENYGRLVRAAQDQGARLIAVQYPGRSIEPLQTLVTEYRDVALVDNGPSFQGELRARSFDELFVDDCYGDLGHGTPLGNLLLADNVADVILDGGGGPP